MTMEGGEVVVRMVLDPSDLDRVLGGRPESLGGGAGGGAGGRGRTPNELAGVSPSMGVPMHIKSFAPTFMSIFKPLIALEAIKQGISMMVRNSQVLNAYQSAMGKVFGAAIDLLLLPFMPIFNLLMTGMMALMGWLMKAGVLEWLKKAVEDVTKWLQTLWRDLTKIFNDIKNFIQHPSFPSAGEIVKDVGKTAKDVASHPAQAAELYGLGLLSSLLPGAFGAPGRLLRTGSWNLLKLGARGIGGIFGGGAGTAAGGAGTAGEGGAASIGAATRGPAILGAWYAAQYLEKKGWNPFEALLGTGGSRTATPQALAAEQALGTSPEARAALARGEMPPGYQVGTQNINITVNGGMSPADTARATLEELQRAAFAQQGR